VGYGMDETVLQNIRKKEKNKVKKSRSETV
jgi:hypothetical protein